MDSITITTVFDNEVFEEGLTPSWGFSCLIQGLEKTILFDTGGEGEILLGNMDRLGLDPGTIEVVILSHFHADHTGGLTDLLNASPCATVYLLETFPDHLKREAVEGGAQLVAVEEPMQICPGAYSTGQMGTAIPEQGLVLQTSKGFGLITGCAHTGIVEMIARGQEILQGPPYLVMGGFHLYEARRSRIRDIINKFREMNVAMISPCHCTGSDAMEMFRNAYDERYLPNGAGRVITLTR